MIRNVVHSKLYPNRKLFYIRRKGHKNIYVSGDFLLKEYDTAKPNYRREHDILTNLNNPNIIPVKDKFYEHNSFFLVLPFYKNGDTWDKMYNTPKPSSNEIINITNKLVKPLVHIHNSGIAHLDIKLENYVLSNDKKNFILIDFEYAEKFQGKYYNQTPIEKAVGTTLYMAPEVQSLKFGPTSDIYSLGRVLYTVIARQHPDMVDIDWKPLKNNVPELEEIIISMLQPNHRLRPTIFEIDEHVTQLVDQHR